ncbi:MAG: hypothetical protein OYL92_03635 [Acidobacteriota bacterium]|nr:hypothetical protein [Acidobacteriota bacterium]MDE3264041.1 hypothetical protein [Acidobacteriota bacterium]
MKTPAVESTFDYLRDLDIPEPSAEEWAAKLVNIELNRKRMIEAAEEVDVGSGIYLTIRDEEVLVRVTVVHPHLHTHQLLGEIGYAAIEAGKELDPHRPFRDLSEPVN